MNRRMVFYTIGKLAKIEALLLLLPTVVSLYYRETKAVFSFLLSAAVSLFVGALLSFISRPRNHVIYAKEGFAIVSSAWIYLSLIGALPFVLSGEVTSLADAFFETVSGFTTTGASVIADVEAVSSKGLLLWRSFTHWIGGMGVLVFIIAIMPGISERSIHILRAEVPGPIVGKLKPKLKDTAKMLYLIYLVITVIEIVFLSFGEMSIFESIVHSFGTAGTGGFGIKSTSIGGYSSYSQWVITVFMLIFGINFNLYYLILLKNVRQVLKSEELWTYLGIVVFSTAAIAINIYSTCSSLSETVRTSAFQVSSIITTTGYSTVDFNLWPALSKRILLILMFIGGCAGSTAGGLKISRIVLMFKMIKREIRKLLRPRSVSVIKFEGQRTDESVLSSLGVYMCLYIICFFIILFILSALEPLYSFETNFTATITCINNVGPGFDAIGPASSFADYSVLSKILLSFTMLMGRLEIFPILLFFSPSTWKRK